ncbi:winged helix-turn-helix transcriptional regulator [Candidatus Woesearchaeota archaeon]|nr:winged helix-turn-helix transcriptional regulator [Candidatus Woesearchaeota archaeon]
MEKTEQETGFKKELLILFEKLFRDVGLDSLSSKLVSYIYLEPNEISMDELTEITGYSLSAVSTKLKPLENIGMIERRKKPGSKKLYFYMDKDLIKLNQQKIEFAINKQIIPLKEALPIILNNNKKSKLPEKEKQIHEIAENYLTQITKMEGLLKKVLEELEKLRQ